MLDHTPSRQVVTEVVDLQKTYGELENEKEELERQLDVSVYVLHCVHMVTVYTLMSIL